MYVRYYKGTKNKYGAKKTVYNGRTYDSKKEAEYSETLDRLKKAVNPADRVVDIEYQPAFTLQEAFTDKNGNKHRALTYKADFRVTYGDGRVEIVDVKGMKTEVYKIKKKLLLYKFPDIDFKEV